MILAPTMSPTTEPPKNVDVNIPWAIASFFIGKISRTMPNAIGNMDIPTPWAIRANIIVSNEFANPPPRIPAEYIIMTINSIFFFPYTSESLPAIGVMTAPAIRYDDKIQDAVLYDTPKSLMKLGIAGSTMVSPYIVTNARLLIIASASHAEDDTVGSASFSSVMYLQFVFMLHIS